MRGLREGGGLGEQVGETLSLKLTSPWETNKQTKKRASSETQLLFVSFSESDTIHIIVFRVGYFVLIHCFNHQIKVNLNV